MKHGVYMAAAIIKSKNAQEKTAANSRQP